MELYLIIIGAVITLSATYTVFYFHRFNEVISKKKTRLYQLTPSLFFAILCVFSLIGILSNTIQKVYALEYECERLQDSVVENKYLTDGFPNQNFEYVYTNYNQFFGGGYSENGVLILCIRQDSPQELLDYLVGRNIPYVFVQNSYSDLLQLRQLIYYSSADIPGILVIGNDEKGNKIWIGTSNVELVTQMFQTYVDSGILEVEYTEGITYQDK